MGILRIVPKGGLSRDLWILDGERRVASIAFQWLAGTARLTVGDTTYDLQPQMRGLCSFVLSKDGKAIARGRGKRTLFEQVCTVDYAGQRYRLQVRSALRQNIVVREGPQTIGYIESERALTNRYKACLPESLPLAVRAFMVALALRLWADR